MNLEIKSKKLNEKINIYHCIADGSVLSVPDWISTMLSSDKALLRFNKTLADSEFEAFFWEVKPVNDALRYEPFEFVIINSNSLKSIEANSSSFSNYFDVRDSVVVFPNLRGDADLVVPKPVSNKTDYRHLAKFVRTAEQAQILDFWKKVVYAYSCKIGPNLKWLSTSGLGVHWLHVRIDSRPKYYQYSEYKYFEFQ